MEKNPFPLFTRLGIPHSREHTWPEWMNPHPAPRTPHPHPDSLALPPIYLRATCGPEDLRTCGPAGYLRAGRPAGENKDRNCLNTLRI